MSQILLGTVRFLFEGRRGDGGGGNEEGYIGLFVWLSFTKSRPSQGPA